MPQISKAGGPCWVVGGNDDLVLDGDVLGSAWECELE